MAETLYILTDTTLKDANCGIIKTQHCPLQVCFNLTPNSRPTDHNAQYIPRAFGIQIKRQKVRVRLFSVLRRF